MQFKFTLPFSLLLIAVTMQYNCLSQDAATVTAAKTYFQRGLTAYLKNDYKTAIESYLVSAGILPKAITYYMLTSSYARSGVPKSALSYALLTSRITPALSQKYLPSLNRLKDWATKVTQAPPPKPVAYTDEDISISSDALTGGEKPGFSVPTPSANENPFPEEAANTASSSTSFSRNIIFEPGHPQQKIPVLDNNNNTVGYINFYGFSGGRQNGGRSTAVSFSVIVSSVANANELNTDMQKATITFDARELNTGTVKTKAVGMLRFRATILSAEKGPADTYYLGSVKIAVNAYPFAYRRLAGK